MTIDALKGLLKTPIVMQFKDGLVIAGEIIDVQDDQDHDQLAYRLLEVLSPGQSRRTKLTPGNYYSSDLQELEAVSPQVKGRD